MKSNWLLFSRAQINHIGNLVLTGAFPLGEPSTAYSHSITISGGDGVYSNPQVVSGSLPPGLSLSISGNLLTLSGTTGATEATYTFDVSVDSGDGQTAVSSQSVVVVVPPVTFDPNRSETNNILSNGNLTVTRSSASYGKTLSTVGHSIGKRYFEITLGTWAKAGIVVDYGTYTGDLGQYTGECSLLDDGRLYFEGNASSTSLPGVNAGSTVMLAMDLGTNQVWFGVDGNWETGADPATGSNPTITLPGSWTTVFAAAGLFSAGPPNPTATARFAPADFLYTPPSGFSPI